MTLCYVTTLYLLTCIVVGGGTAGAVLASRLTEDDDVEVLLIEAGGDESNNDAVDIPIFTDQVRGSHTDWSYRTVPQRHACKGHIDQVGNWKQQSVLHNKLPEKAGVANLRTVIDQLLALT